MTKCAYTAFKLALNFNSRPYVEEDAKLYMKKMVDSGLWVPTEGADPGLALRGEDVVD